MSATVQVAFDVRAREFICECSACGWVGRTTRLEVIAVPLAEHIKGCDGTRRMRMQRAYDADAFDRTRRHELRARSAQPESKSE
ncbi:hypothetical protein MMUR_23780 [Mycolicibacterium murale]|uniref:Uncharacterized protein n=1 Tax=Mycolicibacterium murale TaxID=182220 RepID=A0A7I9WKF4_9MYCO|nr:hypothetical protein MMUR_23780 [Mycolicibacterium murale]